MTTLAHINREVLRWAINRAGPHVDVAQFQRWLDDKQLPTINQAQKLAKKLAIPFGYLFLSESPQGDDLPIPDLRTRDDRPLLTPSLDLRQQLDWIAAKQQWFAEVRRQRGEEPVAFVGALSRTTRPTEVDAAGEIDRTFQLAEVRAGSRNWADYLTRLCRRAESLGVLVMRSGVVGMNNKRPLSAEEFQGFAIAERMAPTIFINTADYVTATVFTFAHELVHVWLGESGITLNDETGTHDRQRATEHYCNRVAAELLVPAAQLEEAWRREELGAQTDRLARLFKVSSTVILRRARDAEHIGRREFFAQLAVERGKQRPKTTRTGGGSGLQNILARNGQLLAYTAVAGALEGRLGYAEAAEALGVKVKTLRTLAKPLGVQ